MLFFQITNVFQFRLIRKTLLNFSLFFKSYLLSRFYRNQEQTSFEGTITSEHFFGGLLLSFWPNLWNSISIKIFLWTMLLKFPNNKLFDTFTIVTFSAARFASNGSIAERLGTWGGTDKPLQQTVLKKRKRLKVEILFFSRNTA